MIVPRIVIGAGGTAGHVVPALAVADALRAAGTARVLGHAVKAASTLGTFLRSFRWGHVRQLDAVSRQLLARAWAAGRWRQALTLSVATCLCLWLAARLSPFHP